MESKCSARVWLVPEAASRKPEPEITKTQSGRGVSSDWILYWAVEKSNNNTAILNASNAKPHHVITVLCLPWSNLLACALISNTLHGPAWLYCISGSIFSFASHYRASLRAWGCGANKCDPFCLSCGLRLLPANCCSKYSVYRVHKWWENIRQDLFCAEVEKVLPGRWEEEEPAWFTRIKSPLTKIKSHSNQTEWEQEIQRMRDAEEPPSQPPETPLTLV